MSSTNVTVEEFGKTKEGQVVSRYTLKNGNGMVVQVINFGAAITSIQVPDKAGNYDDVVLAYPTVEDYENDGFYIGEVVGRVANRIGNGKITVNGTDYQLTVNNGPNHLHGGFKGFSRVYWDSTVEGNAVKFTYVSADGEEGYPGQLTAQVKYQLSKENEVIIHITAHCTQATPVNLTNHSYFNLAGHGTPDMYDHQVTIKAENYIALDEHQVPTGEIKAVQGSLYDLREPVTVGDRIHQVPGGYDNSFCLQSSKEKGQPFARVVHPKSGRVLEAFTTQPSVHFYTGNYLEGVASCKDGKKYPKHSGLCLETQNYPNAINRPNFPNSILQPGEMYDHTTWYKFSVLK
ncbi:galactose mutarotase-like isoform X2 [Ptychodera flava]